MIFTTGIKDAIKIVQYFYTCPLRVSTHLKHYTTTASQPIRPPSPIADDHRLGDELCHRIL